MRYFIHADDFGLRSHGNIAVDKAFRAGWIQRASLIVNIPVTEEACALAKEGGYQDRICFHLNLTHGEPLTDPIKNTFFCGPDGKFWGAQLKTMAILGMSPRVIRAIRQECEAQMQRFRDLGFTSSHIDAHFWCMCAGPVWQAIRPLVKQYGFTTTRTLQGHQFSTATGIIKQYLKAIFHSTGRVLRYAEDSALLFKEFRHRGEVGGFEEDECIELYVHPRMVDGVCKDVRNSRIIADQFPMADIAAAAKQLGTLIDPGKED